jgi:predicted dehydrogenase
VVEDGPAAGKVVPVEADDNWQLILDFGNGCLASLAANNVVYGSRAPQVEIHGLEGTIVLDPIDVSAPVELLRKGKGWQTIRPPFPGDDGQGRQAGPDHHLGVAHLVACIQQDQAPLLSIDHALHVLGVIETAALAAGEKRVIPV